jgi:hypothetical protein
MFEGLKKYKKIKRYFAIGVAAYWVYKTISDKNIEIETLEKHIKELEDERRARFYIDARNYNAMLTIQSLLRHNNVFDLLKSKDLMNNSDYVELKDFIDCNLRDEWSMK